MLGIDIGGSKVTAVLVKNYKIIWQRKYFLQEKSDDEIFKIINDAIYETKEDKIGVGIPGTICGDEIVKCPNFKDLNGVCLSRELACGNIKIENDANCFALGEYFNHKKDLVGITVGSGIGGGIIIGGKLFHGSGDAGEFGHITIYPNGRKCSCGNRGCLEEYVSIKAIKRETMKKFKMIFEPLDLFNLAKRGDNKAIEIFNEMGRYLGIGLSIIANILNPNLISIGGGISNAGQLLLEPAEKEMKKRLFISKPKIILGNEFSGAYGAALLWG
jgi:predicted NBD/HSP70 family sugar kinase